MGKLVVISDRAEDQAFAQEIATKTQLDYELVTSGLQLKQVLKDNKDPVIFWDVDHKHAIEIAHPLSISSIGQVLKTLNRPNRVFAISTLALNTTPFIFNMPVFAHHIYRQYNFPAPDVIAKLVKNSMKAFPFNVAAYLPDGTKVNRIQLKNSGQRKPALDAIQKILTTVHFPEQLITMVIEAIDELLMNAIFDAPSNGGASYRRTVTRSSNFELTPKEMVTLELGISNTYMVVAVADNFGSLKNDTVLSFIRKDYENMEYKVKESEDKGAGLGIYRMIQGGLSLAFICQPNVKTEIMLFVPLVKTVKAYRTGFRFFSFL